MIKTNYTLLYCTYSYKITHMHNILNYKYNKNYIILKVKTDLVTLLITK